MLTKTIDVVLSIVSFKRPYYMIWLISVYIPSLLQSPNVDSVLLKPLNLINITLNYLYNLNLSLPHIRAMRLEIERVSSKFLSREYLGVSQRVSLSLKIKCRFEN